jgi:hypothetical protein
LYADTYTDYLEMARLWYHGDRRVQKWMHHAQDQLSSEAASVYTETDRSSFIGLATGNAHTHPNYVLLRDLDSYPLPLLLRKDPRLGFHKEAHTALMAHADPTTLDAEQVQQKEGARTGMASSQRMRVALANVLGAVKAPVPKLRADAQAHAVPDDVEVKFDDKGRLSLEVVEDGVEMVVTSPRGERRILSRPEQDVLSLVARQASLGKLKEAARLEGVGEDFVDELVAAGVLIAA